MQSATPQAKALTIIAILIISVWSFYPVTRAASASTGSIWYAGATSTDSSAIPNYGVRSVIDVESQPNIPAGSDLLPWVAVTLSNNIWIQAGYYNQPTGTGTSTPPKGFLEIWNLNTYTILQTLYPPVTTGKHIFSIYLVSGTTWAVSYDNTIWTTYDTGSNISSSNQPIEAMVEMQAPSMLSINTVDFPVALQVLKTAGGPWTNVNTAISGYNGFGVQGQIQNSSLPAGYANIGTSIPVAHGATLWDSTSNTTNTAPVVTITSPTSNSWNGGTITVPVSAAAYGSSTISSVQLYVDNNLIATDSSSPYNFNLDTMILSNAQHNMKVLATDSNNNLASSSININVDNTAPTITVPTSMTVAATTATGAQVTYPVTATDDGVLSSGPICTPPSGSTFPIGTTTILCTATDSAGNTATAAFTVTVIAVASPPQSTTTSPPTLQFPSSITVQATSSTGATASYAVKATDYTGLSIPVSCSLPSGSTFPIASTTVTCTATDTYGNTASGTFTVTVADTTAPTATITSPTVGSKVSGTVTIFVLASDNTGVGSVAIYIDGKLKITDTSAPYSYSWNTKSYKAGTHTIMAIVTDAYGNHISVTDQVIK